MNQPTPQPGEPRAPDNASSSTPRAVPRKETAHAPPDIRASDAEREAVVERLRVASVEGRLTFEELTERTDATYTAVTRAELDRITVDLPGMGAPGANPAPTQVTSRFTAIMGDCKESVHGRIDRRLEALSVMGDVVLDLRYAQVPSGEVEISATAVMGEVKIIVPDGVVVEMSGYAVLGERKILIREAPEGRRLPVVRVRACAVMGDVKVIDDEHHRPIRRAMSRWWSDRKNKS